MADKLSRSIKLKFDLRNINNIKINGENISDENEFLSMLKATHEMYHEGVKYYQEWLLKIRQEDVYFEDLEKPSKTGVDFQKELIKACKNAQKDNLKDYQGDKSKILPVKGNEEEILRLFKRYFDLMCPTKEGKNDNSEDKINDQPKGNLNIFTIHSTGEFPRSCHPLKEKYLVLPLFPKFLEKVYSQKFNIDPKLKGMAPFDYSMWTVAVSSLRGWNTWNSKAFEDYKKIEQEANSERENLNLTKKEIQALESYEKERDLELEVISEKSKTGFKINKRMIRCLSDVLHGWNKKPDQSLESRKEVLNKLQTKHKGKFGDPDFFLWLSLEENRSLWTDDGQKIYSYVKANSKEQEKARLKSYARCTLSDPYLHPRWYNFEKAGTNQPWYDLVFKHDTWYLSFGLIDVQNNTFSIKKVEVPIRDSEQMRPISTLDNKVFSYKFDYLQKEFICNPKGAKLQFKRNKLQSIRENTELQKIYKTLEDAYFNITWEIVRSDDVKPKFRDILHPLPIRGKQDNVFLYWSYSKKEKSEQKKKEKIKSKFGLTPLSDLEFGNKISYGIEGLTNSDSPRLMFVDMGVRSFGACTIFHIQKNKPKQSDKMYFEMKPYPYIQGEPFYAVHDRSFLLALYGEDVSNKSFELNKELQEVLDVDKISIKELRNEITKRRKEIRQKIKALSLFRRSLAKHKSSTSVVSKELQEKRVKEWEGFQEIYSKARHGWPFPNHNAEDLDKSIKNSVNRGGKDFDNDLWIKEIDRIVVEIKDSLEEPFKNWRKFTRKIGSLWAKYHRTYPVYGLSMFGLEELVETRKLMIQWKSLATESGKGKSKQIEVDFAKKMLEHIAKKKEDRLKKASDALIKYTLGFEWVETDKDGNVLGKDGSIIALNDKNVPTELIKKKKIPKFKNKGFGNPTFTYGRWVSVYPPCMGVVFEDLSKFRTSEEKSRRENSQLMKWAHRVIPSQIRLQSEIFGLEIGNVGASYSSRFHARTGAPGLRANVFTIHTIDRLKTKIKEVLGEKYLSFNMEKIENELKQNPSKGLLFPMEGGEYFVTFNTQRKLVYLNADINAAQNLAKRFLTRYDKPEKISVILDKNQNILINRGGSVRVDRQMGFAVGQMILSNNKTIDELWKIKSFKIKFFKEDESLYKNQKSKSKSENPDYTDETEEEFSGIRTVFCDHSGILLPNQYWYSAKIFWRVVKWKIAKQLLETPIFIRVTKDENQ